MSSKSPELLARYCDLLLRKSSKNPEESELEDTLNQVVSGAALWDFVGLCGALWGFVGVCRGLWGFVGVCGAL